MHQTTHSGRKVGIGNVDDDDTHVPTAIEF